MLPALVVAAVALLVVLVLVVLLVRSRRSLAAQRLATDRSETRLAQAEAATEQVRAELAAASARADAAEVARHRAELEREDARDRAVAAERREAHADAAVSETAALAARLVDDGAADPAALWALEQRRSERTWRHSVAAVPGSSSPLEGAADPLRAALEIEVAAVREEVGAVIDLTVDVPDPLTAGASLATLRVAQELLAAAAKRGEATSVAIRVDGQDLIVRVETVDADGTDIELPPLAIPPSRLEPAGGSVRLRAALAAPDPVTATLD